MKRISFILISIFFIAVATAADKEVKNSFDCNKAYTTLEHLICAEPQLTALVKKMEKAYIKKKKSLSSIKKKVLESEHKKWLQNRGKECKLTTATTNPTPVLNCLIDSYNNRIIDIEETTQSRTAYYRRSISNDRFTPYERKKWRKLVKWPDSCEFTNFGFMEKSGIEFIKVNQENFILNVMCEPYVDTGHYELYLIDLSGKSVKTRKLNLRQYKYDDDKWVSYTSNYIIGQLYHYSNVNELGIFHKYSKDVMCGHQVEYKINVDKNNEINTNITKANGNYDCNKNMRRIDWPKIKLQLHQ